MKLINYISGLAFVALLTSCSVTMPITATNNASSGKVGKASNSCLSYGSAARLFQGDLIPVSGGWCFNDKNYDIATAAKNGGISKVATVDLKITNYIIYYEYELIVTGE